MSRLQPLDLGVVHCLKAKYRKSLATIESKSELKLNVMQPMHMIVASWNAVSSATIVNCFRKAGFTVTFPPGEDEDEDDVREEDWRKLSSKIDFSDFVICDDDDDLTTSRLSIEDRCDAAEKDMENKDA
jgi:hypothetical protein